MDRLAKDFFILQALDWFRNKDYQITESELASLLEDAFDTGVSCASLNTYPFIGTPPVEYVVENQEFEDLLNLLA